MLPEVTSQLKIVTDLQQIASKNLLFEIQNWQVAMAGGKKLLVVFLYLGLNSFLNLLNKWALGVYGFKFPVVMTVMHMIFSFLFLLPIMIFHPSYAGQHHTALKTQWKGVVMIGSFMAINIALNNASLVTMTLSLNQVIRASIPCFTGVFAIFVEKRYPTPLQGMGLAPISLVRCPQHVSMSLQSNGPCRRLSLAPRSSACFATTCPPMDPSMRPCPCGSLSSTQSA
eukprot:1181959-Prorocentrum_minimum.AAC.1